MASPLRASALCIRFALAASWGAVSLAAPPALAQPTPIAPSPASETPEQGAENVSASAPEPSPEEAPDEPSGLLALGFDQLLDLEVESASKRPQAVIDAANTVTIITREDIRRYGYVTFEELLFNLPHFFLIDDYEDVVIGLRGSAGGGIQFLLNGVPLYPTNRVPGISMRERGRLNVPIEAIDRLEIVRGPMSVIYGNNAFLGSVNIITNDPDPARMMLSAGAGSNRQGRAFARAATRFEGGSIVVNGGFYATDGIGGDLEDTMSDAQLAALPPGSVTSLDGYLARRELSFDVSATIKEFTLNARLSHMTYGAYFLLPAIDEGTEVRRVDSHISSQYLHRFDDTYTFRALATYSQDYYDASIDFIVPDSLSMQRQRVRRAEVELNLLISARDRLELTLGYRFQALFDILNEADIPPLPLFVRHDYAPWFTNDFFAQANVRIVDSLQLTAGARLSHTGALDTEIWTGTDRAMAARIVDTIDSELHVVPSAGLIFSPSNHHTVKAIYGQAVQTAGTLDLTRLEENSTVELSYTLAHERFVFETGLYRADLRNLQRTTQQWDPVNMVYVKRVDGSGRLVTYGVETEVRAIPIDHWNIEASFTYQYTNDEANPDIPPGNSPRMLGQIHTSYETSGFTFALFADFVGEMRADWAWTDMMGVWQRLGDDVDAYVSLGANVRYDHDATGIYASVHGSNLLNADIRFPANELINWEGGGFGPPLSIFATVGLKR